MKQTNLLPRDTLSNPPEKVWNEDVMESVYSCI